VENANFSLLGAQVSDLLAAYALQRDAAAQDEAQKKKAQAAAARQRKTRRGGPTRAHLGALRDHRRTAGTRAAGAADRERRHFCRRDTCCGWS